MSRQVVTRPSANADIAAQMSWYIRNATPDLSERFYGAVQETAETLREFPGMGARHGFITPAIKGVLMLPVKGFAKHLMIYLPTEDGIDLIRVYHAARDIDQINPTGA